MITVVDRGFSSDENLRYLTRAGGHWIAGERMRDGSADANEALARPGRYHPVRDNLKVKEVTLRDARRGQAVHRLPQPGRGPSATRPNGDTARPDQRLHRAARGATAQAKTDTAGRRTSRPSARSAPTRPFPLPAPDPVRAPRIDRAKVAAEKRLDGKFLISTSDPHLTAEDAALGYKNLLEAERCFRDLKDTLQLRPVFHRLEQRIRAHVLICWLALLLVRVAERQTHDTWRNLRRELERLHLVTLQGDAGPVSQTTELTPRQREILHQLQLEPPPRLTSLTPTAT